MTDRNNLTARAAAWQALNQCDILRHDTAAILNRLLSRTDRPAQAADIVFGVIRSRGTLDYILKKYSKTDSSRVKTAAWNLLRIAVYELIYAPKTADYAIVNEAVQLARDAESAKLAGFINAVLRNVQRAVESRLAPLQTESLRRMIPQTTLNGCLFADNLLPDPVKETTQYLSTAFSLPQDLVNRWLKTYGPEQTRMLCFASNRHPSIIVQPNILLVTAAELAQRLAADSVQTEMKAGVLRIRSTGRINTYPSYLEGLFYIQDTAAFDAIALAHPQSQWAALDLCAAPGGKCITLAMLTRDAGTILASDSSTQRLQMVRQNIQRLRLQSVKVIPGGHIHAEVRRQKTLNLIILDVPCSNTGVLARRIEVRWRWKPRQIESLQQMQRRLLEQAVQLAGPETKILYSTCSIQPEENQHQIAAFLAEHRRFALEAEKLTLPAVESEQAFDHDGAYSALLRPK
ncbi:MAG: hypothetical protein KBI46_07420 [Phycisphaerae bacterium]|nr:hypothetical protein [Phycisphaerae bacterium]